VKTRFGRCILGVVVFALAAQPLVVAPALVEAGDRNGGERRSEQQKDDGKRREGKPDFRPPPTRHGGKGQVEIFRSTNAITLDASEHIQAGTLGSRASDERFGVKVYVSPMLAVDRENSYQYVSGNVVGWTNQPNRAVNWMRIGGVLLRARSCSNIFNNDPLEGGDVRVERDNDASRGWTEWYRGSGDCWNQTGHNYFSIRFPERPGTWERWVTDDEIRDF
jgi:hypothetical protein